MLPGFRFLFAAILLSTSLLVFGLGAAALLRAAHEEVASIPARRAPPEPVFAQSSEPAPPTLALLRVEPVEAEKPAEPVVTPEQAPAVLPVEPDKLAALKPEPPATSETAASPDTVVTTAAAPATAEAPAVDQPRLATAVDTPPASEDKSEAMSPPESSPAAATIATLGGPAVTIAGTASLKPDDAKPDSKPKKRRRAAQRAGRTAAVQETADPFALQPAATRR